MLFKKLLGHEIPDGKWGGELGMNDAICQMYYAKSPAARLIYKILTNLKKKSEEKGKPDLNILFIYNMPFCGIAKMTNGMVSMDILLLCVQHGRYRIPVSGLHIHAGDPRNRPCRNRIHVATERNASLRSGFYMEPFGI